MTAATHDSSAPGHHPGYRGPTAAEAEAPRRRPGWLKPAIAAAALMAVLLAFDVISLSMAFYLSLAGGMLLMHLGGHGGKGLNETPDGGEHTRQ